MPTPPPHMGTLHVTPLVHERELLLPAWCLE